MKPSNSQLKKDEAVVTIVMTSNAVNGTRDEPNSDSEAVQKRDETSLYSDEEQVKKMKEEGWVPVASEDDGVDHDTASAVGD